ncbi:DEKNAAC102826 [Brettanomyces naardenensis]|uniref:DEKNAAC102826 n=1 Tax=Brettanomyces naardenensis TaxID=13370 RepID=A0A448YLP1_BRENA|nr:DEKNAAC102826 [Brettanomyces naardenensis]
MEKLQELLEWAVQNGTYIDKRISFQEIEGRGISAVINSDIDSGENLIKVPKDIFLTPDIAESYFKSNWKAEHDRNEQLQLLLARLKFEKEDTIVDGVNISQKMAKYVDFLPSDGRSTGLPYFWTEEEKDLLRGTDAEVYLKTFMNAIVDEWYSAVSGLEGVALTDDIERFYTDYKRGDYNKGMAIFLEQKIDDWTSFPAYLWAHCILASRAFPCALIDPSTTTKLHKAFLIPVLDLLNHKEQTTVSWKYQDSKFVSFNTTEDPQNLKKGHELFNSYGDKPNDQLLLGYGFIIPDNELDTTTLTLKVDKDTVDGARQFGVKLPSDASELGINFVLKTNDALPEELVDFFAYLVRLKSEDGIYTTRMKLEGLANLRSILDTKVNVFRNFKFITSNRTSPDVVKLVRVYRTSHKVMFQSALDEALKLEKHLLKKYKPLSFKKVLKLDKTFFNSLLLTFGVMNYDDLVRKKLLDQAVLLWIVRNANKEHYSDEDPSMFPAFIYDTFIDVKKNVPVTAEDVVEFREIYKSLFPALSERIPEVYGVGDWSPRNFIVAGTVSDRLTFKRPANSEVYFLKREQSY